MRPKRVICRDEITMLIAIDSAGASNLRLEIRDIVSNTNAIRIFYLYISI